MRIHSTGLGKGELIASQDKLIVRDGYLVLSVRSTAPVHWHIRVLMERRDVWRFLLAAFKGPAFFWLLSLFRKPGPPPTDY
jgi:hypothetical protein